MLSAIVIALNEELMIASCLESLSFADEIIVVDTGSTDKTNLIAKSLKARIVASSGRDYSGFRNDGLAAAKGDWILYVDADERVSDALRTEIQQIIKSPTDYSAYAIPRDNYYLGKLMRFGGWGDDYVIRLFRKNNLQKFQYPLHEQPIFSGKMGKLKHPLLHYSHRDLTSMLEKTLKFTTYEARLRYNAGHPKMAVWRLVRVMCTEFWNRFVKLRAAKDGPEGIIDGIFQVFNTFIIYAKLWELQQKHESSGS